ncbi:MAG: MoxR family ATPase [Candidatus Marinimicrobia bacterium]|nr:MoxR family ATPase [Candidatus Neomarinimicrobiota bacterium]HOG74932.1 MoxR family ATPase [Candidatus Neomarinimicrobiota bacterium]HOU17017.1 MoxR family ATPase [Candidatus Neomarinimicrobiota bacterium]HOV23163.1 MoxR family ATPase [Candidatus Neomarinimicrobiota bacterium]HPA99575.1 MoxR family ATPase [Candidatus Neomarinimicrobiota bacterium]
MTFNLAEMNERIQRESAFVSKIKSEMAKVIVGQEQMIERMLIGLLCNGHILLEGVPGLAKSLAVSTLAKIIQVNFRRIQFTPDLLPADLVGTMIYNQKTGTFETKRGPIFSNIILADEINRSPAKVQSALLEAMQERQVTIGETSHPLDDPFMVLATQNPIEQEGTYPLPEAQVDRFMLKVIVDYPQKDEELDIVKRMARNAAIPAVNPVITAEDIRRARQTVDDIYIDEKIHKYIVDLVFATRDPKAVNLADIADLIQYGASPRASIFLAMAGKAQAFIAGRGYVTPEDIRTIIWDVMRHRIILTFEAEAEEVTVEEIIRRIIETVAVP